MRLISFSLYGSDPKYWQGMLANIELAKTYYPSWKVVIYVSLDMPTDALQALANTDATIIYREPEAGSLPMFWRFLAASELSVTHAIFRDADSRIGEREAAAVNEWMESNCLAHSMHDHRHHRIFPLHGGMWGIRGNVICDIREQISQWHARTIGSLDVRAKWGDDQHFLRAVVWPRVKSSTMHHVCDELLIAPDYRWGGRPFPVISKDGSFVGQQYTADGEPITP